MQSAPASPPHAAPPPAAPDASADRLTKLLHVGNQSITVSRLDEAAWCFEQAALLAPNSAAPLKGLAKVRHLQGRVEDARHAMTQALARDGADAESHAILGQICQAEGDFAAATAAFRQSIAIDPAHGPAHLRLALLAPQDNPARIAELERVLALPDLSLDQQATLGFALGREYESAGAFDRSFEQYHRANTIRGQQHPGYSNTFRAAADVSGVFTPALMAALHGAGDASVKPVFIVGMMRSGTTLVEQILASHPQVHGHGELPDIRQIAAGLHAEAGGEDYPGCVRRLDRAVFARYGTSYLARREATAPLASRHIDKLPHNFEHLGLIALLFPQARFIQCTRDPADTCVSTYFQDFGHLNTFTYDLATLGTYCRELQRLMDYWATVLPGRILRIPYEQIVADQEGWSRRMVGFLGLNWDPACLAYHRNKRAVHTKSLWQVRQPIFTTSIGRWRPYARHLGPLFAALSG